MPITGEYEPSTSAWVADQVAEYEASGGTRAAQQGAVVGRGDAPAASEQAGRVERPHPRLGVIGPRVRHHQQVAHHAQRHQDQKDNDLYDSSPIHMQDPDR